MKILLKIYISFALIFTPIFFINSANAATFGGWSIGGLVANGASAIAQGTKQVVIDGKDYIKKGTAKITPTASQVSKVLARGAAGYALSVAVEQLLGAVDWVLDPANNQIRYKDPDASNSCTASNVCGATDYYLFRRTPTVTTYYTSVDAACRAVASSYGQTLVRVDKFYDSQGRVNGAMCHTKTSSGSPDSWGLDVIPNPAYDPNATDEDREKTLPLETVAQKVISNAQAGDPNAQVATTAAAQDIINEAEQDEAKARPIVQQLEASSSTENADSAAQDAANEATGQSQPNTANPQATNIKLNFPVFCGWAPIVCEAAQVAISFPAKAQIWVNDLLGQGEKIEEEQKRTTAEAAKTAQATQAIQQELTNEKDLPAKDTSTVLLPDVPITPQTVNVNWGNSCPAPTTVNLSFGGQTKQVTILNYQFICEWAWVVEYSVIALASISSVFIVAGRKS
jgi:hypothetical protein